MTEPSTRSTADPASAGIHTHIERLKATEELLSSLLSQARPASGTFASTQDAEPPAASPRTGRRLWRRRSD